MESHNIGVGRTLRIAVEFVALAILLLIGSASAMTPTITNHQPANISNDNGSNIQEWIINDHPTTYFKGNRIWDGSRPDEFALTYSWDPMSFSGFYYNTKDDVGTEKLTMTLGDYTTRTILKNNFVYTTSPQEVNFAHSGFGKYQILGFMADKYFAAYTANTSSTKTRPTTNFDGISALSQGELHKVLIDDNIKRTISVGGTLAMQDGYVLKARGIDLNNRTMFMSLLKDGNEVDVFPLSADETYVYSKNFSGIGNLPLIMVRVDNVFSGQEVQAAFLKGLFQISEDATIVKAGNQFGKMEVTGVSSNSITMSNNGSIGLDKNKNDTLMGNIRLKVADSDALRFYFSVDVTPEIVANRLAIDAPAKAKAGDTIRINVAASGNVMDNARVMLGTDFGNTDKDGSLTYTLPKNLNGTYNIIATKTGYENATRDIVIEKYAAIPISAVSFVANKNTYIQGEKITFTAINNGTIIIDLPSSAPWQVENVTTGEKVFIPIGLTVITPIEPGQSISWIWDQNDEQGKQVPHGIYRSILGSGTGNSYTQDFEILPPQASGANAEREIEKGSLGKGESTNITIKINSSVIQASSLKESIPEGWNLTRISDDADGFKNSTNEWIWSNMTPGITKTVFYAITAPTDAAPGTYYINGTISNSSGVIAVVGGNNIITLDLLSYYRGLGGNPDKVETRGLLKAMDDWRSKTVPSGFADPITNQELSALINEWIMS